MSLEEALKQNTEAINKLIAAIAAFPVPSAGAGGATAVQEAKKPEGGKPSTGSAKESEGSAVPKDTGEWVQLEYKRDIREPFLHLLNTNRDKAMALLAELGVANLKGYESHPEKYAFLAAKIEEASK